MSYFNNYISCYSRRLDAMYRQGHRSPVLLAPRHQRSHLGDTGRVPGADLLAGSNVANMWTVCQTDVDGEPAQRYYVNEYTRIVSFDCPVGFVEPADAERRPPPADSTPVSKNVIKRRRKVPTPKGKRENPYSKPTEAECVKIELISSFSTKSDSSSEGEDDSSNKQVSGEFCCISPVLCKLMAFNDDNYTNT